MPCLTVCLVFIIWILNGLIHKQFACGGDVNSSQDYEHWQKLPLTFAWIFKPPYATPPSNESLDNEAQGLMRDAVLKHIAVECGYSVKKHFDIKTLEMENEFAMLELLRQNKVHIALPIFEHPSNRRYPEFPFFKLDDYPGTEYITVQDDSSTLTVVLDSVIKAWPLLAVTMVLTAIAGIIMWALVGINLPLKYSREGIFLIYLCQYQNDNLSFSFLNQMNRKAKRVSCCGVAICGTFGLSGLKKY